MSRFPLLRATVGYRGQDFTVRQMTAGEKMRWAKESKADPRCTLTLAVEIATEIEPRFTAAELADEPTGLVEALAEKIFELNGEGPDEKKASPGSSEQPAA